MLRTALVALTACSSTPHPSTLSGVSLFCAPGSIGLRPDPLPPDYDVEYVVAVVDINNPGEPLSGIAIQSLELDSKPISHLRRVQEVGVFPATAVMPPLL
jgi:hypothetical protein